MEERQSVEISEYISPLLETLPHSVPKMVDYLK